MTDSVAISPAQARAAWLGAQALDTMQPFGAGPDATRQAIEHLGYVQIDTINVIERSHHHILYTRIPDYARGDLAQAQSADKSVFEYWTHALAYIGMADYRCFLPAMERFRANPASRYAAVDPGDYAGLLKRIRDGGPLSIRDIDDDVLVEKTHPWGSRKPSRTALRYGFYAGDLVVARRAGMLKTYDLAARHFGWARRPRPASPGQVAEYLLRRALRAQAVVSLGSICYGNLAVKADILPLIEAAVRRRRLVPVHIDGYPKLRHWVAPSVLETAMAPMAPIVHLLSPFDPLVIQRKRLSLLFGYDHRFEAYVPPDKRVLGYFALPVLVGDEIVAAIDLKTDRQSGKLRVQQWTWLVQKRAGVQAVIDEALSRFERFQLAPGEQASLAPETVP
jgi:uncharacterized protein YcaQ